MDAQTYLLTYRANEARRAVETERRRQNNERLAQQAHAHQTSRRSRRRGVAAHTGR